MLWDQCLGRLEEELPSQQFNTWIKPLKLDPLPSSSIVLLAPNRFIRDWVLDKFLSRITEIYQQLSSTRCEIKVVASESTTSAPKQAILQPQVLTGRSLPATTAIEVPATRPPVNVEGGLNHKTYLNSTFTFNSFVEGKSNQLALAASRQIADNPGGSYNPLFIYGAVGLGKTHLMHAVGNELRRQKPNAKIVYLHSERFVADMVKALQLNAINDFKRFYRSVDALLIDDMQFFAGKERSQEEFFHTFNALLDKGSQVIISADRAPNKLPRIQERIKSRFSGGLVVDIQKPDYELRYKIVKQKTVELNILHSNQLNISDEVLRFISLEVKASVRELVGAINRVISFSRVYKKIANISETKVVLKDLLNLSENKVTIDLIQSLVCKFFKISKNEMLSSRRSRYLVRPRQTAIYLTKILTSKSLPEIGREFSNRDHTTIIHSVKTIEKLKKEDDELSSNIDILKNQILYRKENEI